MASVSDGLTDGTTDMVKKGLVTCNTRAVACFLHVLSLRIGNEATRGISVFFNSNKQYICSVSVLAVRGK